MSSIRTIKIMMQGNPEAINKTAGCAGGMKKHSHKSQGFTLIELLIVVSITTILATIAIPSMSESIKNSKVKELSSEFTAALHLTQTESIKRGIQVSMRPKQVTGSTWQTGWDVFVDTNRDGIQDAGEELIQAYTMPSNNLTLVSKDSTFASWLAFQPSGASRGTGGMSGGFRICRSDANTAKSRNITIQGSGNVIIEEGTLSCP